MSKRASENTGKRKQTSRSFGEKAKIIKFADDNPGMRKWDIAVHFGMGRSSLTDILKDRDRVLAMASAGKSSNSKMRKQAISHQLVDDALIQWFQQKSLLPDLRFDGAMFLEQANRFRELLEPDSDTITMSWIERFKQRNGIGRIQKSGESSGVDVQVVREWKDGRLVEILKRYEAEDIFNADETGLFWLMLPDNSLGFVGQSHHGSKQSKQRLTLLVGSNMDGSEKLPLLMIGKSQKPRAFKNIKVPIEYLANKKAWMTGSIFEEWLVKLDKRMRLIDRKIAMFVDNCPAHPQVKLSNIELIFLPPNTTSHTQPMDAGIIKNLKLHYRHTLAVRRLEATSEGAPPFSWNILDAVIAIKAAWRKVKPETIQNCFKKAGFVKDSISDDEQEQNNDGDDDDFPRDCRNIWDRLRDVYGEIGQFDDFVDADNNVETSALLTDEEIASNVQHKAMAAVNEEATEVERIDDNSEEVDPIVPKVSMSEAREAVKKLRYYGLQLGDDVFAEDLDNIDQQITKRAHEAMRQSRITDFFGEK